MFRPTSVFRHTYENIKETGVFTINHIDEQIIEDAHHTSAKYEKGISEFDVTNLKESTKMEFMLLLLRMLLFRLALKYIEEYPIKANNTILVIGQISELYVDNSILKPDGYLDLAKANVAAINGLDGYTIPVLKERLEYQRPKSVSVKN